MMGMIDTDVSESLHDDDVLMQLKGGHVTATMNARMEQNSVSSFTGVDSFILDGDDELRLAVEVDPSKTTVRRNSSLGSSAHTSGTSIADSDFDYEYGSTSNDPKGDLKECLKNWDDMLNMNKSASRLNSSLGDLAKTKSSRNFEAPKPARSTRRMSVCGYTPSETMERRSSFQQTYKETIDDWNSELPVDDDEEDPYERYKIKAPTTTKETSAPVVALVNDAISPLRKLTKTRSKRVLKTNSNDNSIDGNNSEHTTSSVRSPLRSMLLPSRSNRRLLSSQSSDSGQQTNEDEVTIKVGKKASCGVDDSTKAMKSSSSSGSITTSSIRNIGKSFRMK